jgi:hypothetical protein
MGTITLFLKCLVTGLLIRYLNIVFEFWIDLHPKTFNFFKAYFKTDACSMAWELLVDRFNLPKEKLFVTYFGGSQNLAADIETRNIWLKIGVNKDHILPFNEKVRARRSLKYCK